MANPLGNKNSENENENRQRSNREPNAPERVRQEKGPSKELQKASHEFREGLTGVEAGMENAEGVENREVSEGLQEDKKSGPAGSLKTGTAQAVQKKAQVKLPRVEVMRTQIAKEIKRQIKVLEHQAEKMSRKATFNPFTYNGVVSKIRELKFILANLANITFETLKGWWMKFVKNISI